MSSNNFGAGAVESMRRKPPREVYRDACSSIAEVLKSHGLRYSRSAQRAARAAGSMTHVIRFQSSRYNLEGQDDVRLWMHAEVDSASLKAWRSERIDSSLASASVAGGMVHRLQAVAENLEWQLADPKTRRAEIDNAVAFIHRVVFPYSDPFNDPQRLIASLEKRNVPGFDLASSVEYCMCFGSAESGQRVLDRFVRERSDLQTRIGAAEAEGRPGRAQRPTDYAETVPWLRRTHGLW